MNTTTPSTLSETDAYEIALTWCETLQGIVRLDTPVAEYTTNTEGRILVPDFQIVQSYDYVAFMFTRAAPFDCPDVQAAARATRAAAAAWFALTCCPGFSGDENPQFWYKVFCTLTHIPKETYQPQVTDAVRFFDLPGRSFPRVRIVPRKGEEATILQAFWNQDAAPDDENERLQGILAKLTPYIRPTRWNRAIPVAVDGVTVELLAELLPSIHGAALSTDMPQFVPTVATIRIDELANAAAVDTLLSHTTVDLQVDSYFVTRKDYYRMGVSESVLRHLVVERHHTTSSSRIRIDKLTMDGAKASYDELLSVLPGTKVVSTLGMYGRVDESEPMKAVWLGYALFHPDAATSTLKIDIHHLSQPQLELFKRMATGNNILAGVNPAMVDVTGYYQARLPSGTPVYHHHQDDSEVSLVLASDTMVTLCAAAPDRATWDEMVYVIVPGVGLGRIQRERIGEGMVCTPASSSIKRLQLNCGRERIRDHTVELVLNYLSVLGHQLTYLDLTSFAPFPDTALPLVLRLCPSLKSLRVRHDGSCWSDDELITQLPEVPRLTELELRVDGYSSEPLIAGPFKARQLGNLTVFRVQTRTGHSFPASRAACLSVLDAYPTLQYFHWHGVFPRQDWDNFTFDERCKRSQALLGSESHAMALAPLSFQCRLAFLSTRRSIGPEIARSIFRFAMSWRPRVLQLRDR